VSVISGFARPVENVYALMVVMLVTGLGVLHRSRGGLFEHSSRMLVRLSAVIAGRRSTRRSPSAPVQASSTSSRERGRGVPASRALVSAHASDRAPTLETYRDAVATGADYVELDIRRTADGELVSFHDASTSGGEPLAAVGYARLCDLAGYQVPTVADVLATMKGRARGHLDLKDTGGEDEVVRLALDVLGPGQFIITTLEDSSAAAIRSRFESADDVPVALSLGRDMAGASPARWLRTRLSELRPLPRLRACGADWVAAERRLARSGVGRQCRRHHVKIMVWTVNRERELRYWLDDDRADVVITDRPTEAIALRDQASGGNAR
jgi:glycerophosphoryl diester phosphodiesterase